MEIKNKPRVLMLLENNPFPKDVRVRQEAQSLIDAGYQVSIICPSETGQPFHEEINGAYIYRYPSPYQGKGFLSYIFEYGYSFLATFFLTLYIDINPGFDIIHAANPPDTCVFIALLYRLFGKKFIFDHHDLAPELYLERFSGRASKYLYQILLWLERISCQSADKVISTNQSYKAIVMKRHAIPESKITIVRNGSDLNQWKPGHAARSNSQDAKITLMYIGAIGFQDGLDNLMYALKDLLFNLQKTNFHCILVGGGEALETIKELAKDLGLVDHVEFVGWVDHREVPDYLKKAEICVAPEQFNEYNDHSTMIKIMEYMASALPIVAFDLTEHRYSAQSAALYSNINEPLSFAQNIAFLMDHPEIREEMGQIGFRRIENELAWHHQAKHLMQVYQSLN